MSVRVRVTGSSLALIPTQPCYILSIGWNQMGAGPGQVNPVVDLSVLIIGATYILTTGYI